MNTRSFFTSAFVAGIVIGFLGNLPVLNFVNCLCCVWAWLGGALAVVLYQRSQGGQPTPTPGQGAGLGAAAGLVGALVGAVVFVLTSAVSFPLMDDLARNLEIEGDLPFQTWGVWEAIAMTFFFLLVNGVLYPVFGALGGVIAASLSRAPRATGVA